MLHVDDLAQMHLHYSDHYCGTRHSLSLEASSYLIVCGLFVPRWHFLRSLLLSLLSRLRNRCRPFVLRVRERSRLRPLALLANHGQVPPCRDTAIHMLVDAHVLRCPFHILSFSADGFELFVCVVYWLSLRLFDSPPCRDTRPGFLARVNGAMVDAFKQRSLDHLQGRGAFVWQLSVLHVDSS